MNDSKTQAETNNPPSIEELRNAVVQYYGEEVWNAVNAGLGVVCSMAIKGRTPLALIYEGPSGTGKSTCINMFVPDREATAKVLYRLDYFTPRAFVSHAANVPKEEIANIDLLPKLKDKVMLTKELAPVFRGNEAELRERFAILAAVLDGKGYQSASGVHGTRGYGEETLFNWLGATTPIPVKTDNVMAQLGNRILRYAFVGVDHTPDSIADFLKDPTHSDHEKECRTLTNTYLEHFFMTHSVSSVAQEDIQISDNLLLELGRLAKLISRGRVEITQSEITGNEEPTFEAGSAEGPHRVALLLKQFAQGLALAAGRMEVTLQEIMALRHIALSSIPSDRRKILALLADEAPKISSTSVQSRLGVSAPTARSYMKILGATGIARFVTGVGNEASRISLEHDWSWWHIGEAKRGSGPESDDERPKAA